MNATRVVIATYETQCLDERGRIKAVDDFVYSKSDGAMPGAREGYFSVAPGYYRSRRFIPIMAGSQSRMMRQR